MKNILLILILCSSVFLISCSGNQVAKEEEILTLVEVKRGDRSSWYDDFEVYRENYRQFKINSDLFLGIGEYKEEPNEAFQSAKQNGESSIKSSLSTTQTTIDNYGNIIDQVMETYSKNGTILYRYILLMEANKVSIYNTAKEEASLVEQARLVREALIIEAENLIENGDSFFLRKKYKEAITSYENSLIKLREAEDYAKIEIVKDKIEKSQEAIDEILYKSESEKIAKNKRITLLEARKNPSIFDLRELKKLYEEKGNTNKVEELNLLIKNKEKDIEKSKRISDLMAFIKSITRDGYNNENYSEIYNNPYLYFTGKNINKEKVKNKIIEDISNRSIIVLIPYSLNIKENSILLEKVLQNKNPNYLIKLIPYDGNISKNDFYKYKSYKIFYIKDFNLKSYSGAYGYFAGFSLNGILKNYKNESEEIINYYNKRSRYTDYTNSLGAKEEVLNENINGF
jgi:hypothetical protein